MAMNNIALSKAKEQARKFESKVDVLKNQHGVYGYSVKDNSICKGQYVYLKKDN